MRKIIIQIIVLLAFIALGEQTWAKSCSLNKGLSGLQLKVLNKAKRIKRIGLNSALLGKEVYKVDVLANNDESQFLVILGEAHIKGPRSSRLGARVNKAFKLRMLEGLPKAESDYIADNNPDLNASLGWGRVLIRTLTFNFFGSSITNAQKKGLTFYPGYSLYTVDKKQFKATAVNSSSEVIDQLKILSLEQKITQHGINLPLEVGPFETPSSDESYILDKRNLRMADNILSYVSHQQTTETPLIIVGSAHNKGLIHLLSEDGYEICSNL